MSGTWYRQEKDGAFILSLHIQPGAKKSGVSGLHGEALKLRLAAPPVDGKANAAVLAYIAELLGISRSLVSLKSGQTSRQKLVRVEQVDEARVAALPGLANTA